MEMPESNSSLPSHCRLSHMWADCLETQTNSNPNDYAENKKYPFTYELTQIGKSSTVWKNSLQIGHLTNTKNQDELNLFDLTLQQLAWC